MLTVKSDDYNIQKAVSVLVEHGLLKPITIKKKVKYDGNEIKTHMDNIKAIDNILQDIEIVQQTKKDTFIVALNLTNLDVKKYA